MSGGRSRFGARALRGRARDEQGRADGGEAGDGGEREGGGVGALGRKAGGADAAGEDPADRRDAGGQKALFTEDTHFVVYMNGQGSEPSQDLEGRGSLTPVFEDLNRYQATMHFNGQSTIAIDGAGATGESYCIAHHLFTDGGERKLMVAWLRYRDTFVKVDGTWLFAERYRRPGSARSPGFGTCGYVIRRPCPSPPPPRCSYSIRTHEQL